MSQVTIGANVYRIDKLDLMTQFHVGRRLLPIVGSVTDIRNVMTDLVKSEPTGPNAPPPALSDDLKGRIAGEVQRATQSIFGLVSKMPDDEWNYVVGACLSRVSRQNGQLFAPVWNKASGTVMFEDMNVFEVGQLCYQVIKESLGNFSLDLLSGSGPAT